MENAVIGMRRRRRTRASKRFKESVSSIYNSYLAHKDDYLSKWGAGKELLKSVMENINRVR